MLASANLPILPFALALLAWLGRRIVIGAVVVPFLRERGVEVSVPLYPWRMRRALSDYARLCAEEGKPPRWLAEIRALSIVGLLGMVAFVVLAMAQDR